MRNLFLILSLLGVCLSASAAQSVYVNNDGTTGMADVSIFGGSNAQVRLASASSVGATSVALNFVPSNTAVTAYIFIDPWTTNCEIRQISSISGTTVNITGAAAAPLNYAHSAGVAVYFASGQFGVPWDLFGGVPNSTTASHVAANVTAFNRISTNLYKLSQLGPASIFIPAGIWYVDGELKPEASLTIEGVSPLVSEIAAADTFTSFTATGSVAIIHPIRNGVPVSHDTAGASGRWTFRNLKINGRSLANSCGILSSPQQPDAWYNLRVDNCKGLYGIRLIDVQQLPMFNIELINNRVGLSMMGAEFIYCKTFNAEQSDLHDILAEDMGVSCMKNHFDDVHLEPGNNASFDRARASNVATLSTVGAHDLVTGQRLTITALSGTGYNATNVVITVTGPTNFTYANTGGDESTTGDLGGVIQPHMTNVMIRSGDDWVFDNVYISNPLTGTLLDFSVANGVTPWPRFHLRAVRANQTSADYTVVNDVQRSRSLSALGVNRHVDELTSGVGTNWATLLTDLTGGNAATPPLFGHGIMFGWTNGPTLTFGTGPKGVILDGSLVTLSNNIVHGATVWAKSATASLTADNQNIATTTNISWIPITSDDGTAGNRTFTISSGFTNGQVLRLEWIGTGATTGELVDDSACVGGGNVRLEGTWTPTQYDTLTIHWNGTDWIEDARRAP